MTKQTAEDAHQFLCNKFNVDRVADDIGTEINLQYVVEAMQEYHQAQLQELLERLEDYKAYPIIRHRNGEQVKLYGCIEIEKVIDLITSKLNTNHE